MTPPISVDGSDITGTTIDGVEVQAISLDGQDVFTASDPRVYFVGGDVSGYRGRAGLRQVTEVNPKSDNITNYDEGIEQGRCVYPNTRLVSYDKIIYQITTWDDEESRRDTIYFDPVASDPNDDNGAVTGDTEPPHYQDLAKFGAAVLGNTCWTIGGNLYGYRDDRQVVGFLNFETEENGMEYRDAPYLMEGTVAEAVQGSIYVLGGRANSSPYTRDTIYKFDPPNSFTEMSATMPFPDESHTSTVMDDKIYVLQSFGKGVFEYDPISDTITNLPDFVYKQGNKAMSSGLGSLYFAAGYNYDSGDTVNDVHKLNLATGNYSYIGGSGRASRNKCATKIDFAE